MSTLLVGYDLNKVKDYEPLWEYLKSHSNWWHHLDSTWIIVTSKTPVQVRDDINRLIDRDDEVLVVDITGKSAAWTGFPERGSQWLRDMA